jgi:hypothetical protein
MGNNGDNGNDDHDQYQADGQVFRDGPILKSAPACGFRLNSLVSIHGKDD